MRCTCDCVGVRQLDVLPDVPGLKAPGSSHGKRDDPCARLRLLREDLLPEVSPHDCHLHLRGLGAAAALVGRELRTRHAQVAAEVQRVTVDVTAHGFRLELDAPEVACARHHSLSYHPLSRVVFWPSSSSSGEWSQTYTQQRGGGAAGHNRKAERRAVLPSLPFGLLGPSIPPCLLDPSLFCLLLIKQNLVPRIKKIYY
eukprot:8547855-Pyramimonas_sp.AAC.1